MPLDPAALGAASPPTPVRWTERDSMLYALGVGAGIDELAVTTNSTRGVPQQALPTMAVTLGTDFSVLKQAGPIDWTKLVHAEQHVELLRALPPDGSAVATTRIAEMWDKGSAALVVVETEGTNDGGAALWRSRASLFIRGAGGWGGERGPAAGTLTPDGPPTTTLAYDTRPEQALLYRLSGDYNPLHSDPEFARRAGFDRPILHGLCTFGFAARAVLAATGAAPAQLRSMSARFAASVYPGDTLTVSVWADDPAETVHFRVATQDGTEALVNGVARLAEA